MFYEKGNAFNEFAGPQRWTQHVLRNTESKLNSKAPL